MVDLADVLDTLDDRLRESVSLVVARGSGGQFSAHKLTLDREAGEGFRGLCRDATEDLRQRAVVPYSATAELEGDEAFLVDDVALLEEMRELVTIGPAAATLPEEPPSALDASVQMYAVVVGDQARATFVRKSNPVIPHAAGGRLLAIGRDRLRRIEEPAFSFFPGFDLVFGDAWVVVLRQAGFERLFKDLGLVERHIADWIVGITDNLPMAEASVEALSTAATGDPRMWRRLREIKSRGHLANVDLQDVRQYATTVGLDPDDVVRDGELVFDPDPTKRFNFLHLLNEDLYEGFLTKERFEVQRKAAT